MKKLAIRIASIFMVVLILGMSLTSTVFAGNGKDDAKKAEGVTLEGQEVRINKFTKVKLEKVNYDSKGKIVSKDYTAVIDVLPQTTDDGSLIDAQWYSKKDEAGNTYYEAGKNLFIATANKDGRIAVTDLTTGRINAWNPTLKIGNKIIAITPTTTPTVDKNGKKSTPTPSFLNASETLKLEKVEIINDWINKHYKNNIIQYTYSYTQSGLFSSKKIEIIRQVRLIEGIISEYFIINDNPKDDITVTFNSEKDKNADADLSDAIAFDKNMSVVNVYNKVDGFTVYAKDFENKKYPVVIDPTSSFSELSYGGELYYQDATYSGARNAASGFVRNSFVGQVGQFGFTGSYGVSRFDVAFDTSSLTNGVNVNSAYLYLVGYGNLPPDNNFTITVQSGMPTYPHVPSVSSDYSYANYNGNGGTLYTSGWNSNGVNYLYLNSTGCSWVNKTGYTKFLLRSSDDINNSTPVVGDANLVSIQTYQAGWGYAPQLYVSYTQAIVPPTVSTLGASNVTTTSATLNGYLSNSGGESCTIAFQYGTTSSYGSSTATSSGYTTGQYFTGSVNGLTQGVTYHYRAVATNTSGTSYGLDQTFTTLPEAPTNFQAAAGNQKVDLSWTKGTGASTTYINFKTTAYPTTINDGTNIYNGSGTSYSHTGLTAGTTYYYSAWSITSGGVSTQYQMANGVPYFTGAPTLTTRDATDVGLDSATLNGYLDALNQVGGDVTLSFEYGKTVAYGSTANAGTLATAGSFYAGITGLDPSTLYHFRAKGVGTNGTGYGADKTFTTGSVSAPTLTTDAATAIGYTYATLNGNITAYGGASVTAYFKWGLSNTALINQTDSISGIVQNGSINAQITGLSPNVTYYFEAVAQNSAGTSYGDIVSFTTTAPSAPSVTTSAATNAGATSATLNGVLTNDGGDTNNTSVQFEWDTDSGAPYANSTGWQTGKKTSDTFTAVISGLTPGDTIYFRASAKNSNSTVYGSELTLTTVFNPPSDFAAKSLGATTIGLTWTNNGDQTYIYRKTGAYPVDRLDGTLVYSGIANNFTDSALTAGVTYFYRAWSWEIGDTWSPTYAQDAATTAAVLSSSESSTAEVLVVPSSIPNLDQTYTNTYLSKIPAYGVVNAFIIDMGIPEGMGWYGITLFLIMILAAGLYLLTGSKWGAVTGLVFGSAIGVMVHTLDVRTFIIILIVAMCLTPMVEGVKAVGRGVFSGAKGMFDNFRS